MSGLHALSMYEPVKRINCLVPRRNITAHVTSAAGKISLKLIRISAVPIFVSILVMHTCYTPFQAPEIQTQQLKRCKAALQY